MGQVVWEYVRRQHLALVAIFLALAGTAFAAATINSKDVANESLKSKDLKDGKAVSGVDVIDGSLSGIDIGDSSLEGVDIAGGEITGGHVANGAITGLDVADGSLGGADLDANSVDGSKVADGSLGGADLDANAIDGSKVADDSLTADDIDESTILGGVARQGAFAEVPGQIDVAATAFQSRGGPSVTVTVPSSGLISVYAEAEIRTDSSNPNLGAVGLFEDGTAFPGLNDCGGGGAALIKAPDAIAAFRRYTTGPPDASTDNCAGRERYGGPIVLSTTPGTHTYELRYVSGGPEAVWNTASFRERKLLVTPLP